MPHPLFKEALTVFRPEIFLKCAYVNALFKGHLKEEIKDMKKNNWEQSTEWQNEEVKQIISHAEILENKTEDVVRKTEMKIRVEIQILSQEMKNDLESNLLLNLQKKAAEVLEEFLS